MTDTDTKSLLRLPLLTVIEMTPKGGALQTTPSEPPERFVARRQRNLLFWLVFVLPTALCALYLFGFASNQYMSEAQIMVREPTQSGGFGSFGGAQLISRSAEQTMAVEAYIKSRDVVRTLVDQDDLRAIYSRPEADALSRFPRLFSEDTFERFYEHYLNWLKLNVDESTGIITIHSFAYRAKDAQTVAAAIIRHSEAFVNHLNARAYDDKLAYTFGLVRKAKDDLAGVEERLTQFRNATGTVDLPRESGAALETLGKLTTEVARMEASLKQQRAMTPNNPGLPSLARQIASYREEIAKLRGKVVGNEASMSTNLSGFERLTFERQLAARGLELAIAANDKARQDAQTPHIYLVKIAEPNLVDVTEYPRRWLGLLLIAALSYATFMILNVLGQSIREHHA